MVQTTEGPAASDRAAETGVASDLADFLGHATEGSALRQAIDARMLALREAGADTDLSNETPTGVVADPTSPRSSPVYRGKRE